MRALIFLAAAIASAPAAAQAPDSARADSSQAWDRGLREQAEQALRRLLPVPSFTDSLRTPVVIRGDSARRRLSAGIYAADPDDMPVWVPDGRLDSAMVQRPPYPVPYMPGAELSYTLPDSLQVVLDSLQALPDPLQLDGSGQMKKRDE